jgi:isoleucyl-tRNA synthetase
MDYKDTLSMPKTDFPMRGNLGVREIEFQKAWEDMDLYKKVLEKNKDNKPFILHDGPPYANGDIHIGHALNKVLKDFVLRYQTMKGNFVPYIPGWDTHGLPIETAVTKKGVNRKEMSLVDYRKVCYEYAMDQVERQKEQFKRLGILGDWDHPYITLTKDFEGRQVKVFAKMVEKGLIYKGLKPVYWSPSSESALAEAEIEYQDKVSI